MQREKESLCNMTRLDLSPVSFKVLSKLQCNKRVVGPEVNQLVHKISLKTNRLLTFNSHINL